jgi:hypothetical protein
MMVAGMLILASALSLIGAQRGGIENLELRGIANKVSAIVSSVASTQGEVSVRITFNDTEGRIRGDRDGGISLPTSVGGRRYKINVTQNSIIIVQGSRRSAAQFSTTVHIWNPDEKDIRNIDYFREEDKMHDHLLLQSGSNLIVKQRTLLVEDSYEFHTFIHKE